MGRAAGFSTLPIPVQTFPDQPVEKFFQWSLMGLLASGFFALAGSGYLDKPTTILTGAGLLLRAILLLSGRHLHIGPRWIAALTLAYIGYYPLDYAYVSREFIPATVHLICFLAVLRALTAHTDRDYFFVKIIAFLELLAATLLSTSLNFFLFLLLFVVFGVATFCCTEIRRSAQASGRIAATGRSFHRRLISLTAAVTFGIVILTAGLFFMLPRTARAAFRTLVSDRYRLPGFSNEVSLGQIGELQQKTTPLLHVRIDEPGGRRSLKWRGAALSQFDGKRWYNPHVYSEPLRAQRGLAILATDVQRRRHGARIRYEVKINSVGSDALFFAGVPEFIQTNLPLVFRSHGDSFRTGLGTSDGAHYYAYSYLPDTGSSDGYLPEPLTLAQRTEYLLLPPLDQRVHTLARATGQGKTALDRAQSIERYLRTNYAYTTDLLRTPVSDPLAHFLFDRRKGHCEYFASAMAVMLRSVGIPSRVITGFQSGVYNPLTHWYVLRASDAHSWVEAWIPGRGWTVFDPTPPDQRGQTPAALWSRWALYLDAADMFWEQWVMHYGIEQQLDLAARIQNPDKLLAAANWFDRIGGTARAGFRSTLASLQAYLAWFAFVLGVSVTGLLFGPKAWRLWQDRRQTLRIRRGLIGASDASLLYSRLLGLLRKRGWEKPSWLTPNEFAQALDETPVSPLVQQATAAYNELRYAGSPEAGARMIRILQELESAP